MSPLIGSVKHKEIYVVKNKLYKYGWGWLLWLGFFLAGIQGISFSDFALNVIAGVIPLVSLIPYFVLRRRFLADWGPPAPWRAGLAAGVVMYLVSLTLFSTVSFVDERLLNKKIQSVLATYKEKVAAFKHDEAKYEAEFIHEPSNARQVSQNIRTISEILTHDKEKQRLFHEMFDDYRQALKGKMNKTGKKSFEQSIDEILSGYDSCCEKRQKSWTLLRTHYITGKRKYYDNYANAYRDAKQSATGVQERIREAFGTTNVSFAE